MKGFRVDWIFPGESDFLAAEVRFMGELFCRVRCERADLMLEVDFLQNTRLPVSGLPLAEFVQLIGAVGDEVRDLRHGICIPVSGYPICLRGMLHAVNDS